MIFINLCIDLLSGQCKSSHEPTRKVMSAEHNKVHVSDAKVLLNLIPPIKMFLVIKFLIPFPLLQTAAVTGTLPHPGHKTLRK